MRTSGIAPGNLACFAGNRPYPPDDIREPSVVSENAGGPSCSAV